MTSLLLLSSDELFYTVTRYGPREPVASASGQTDCKFVLFAGVIEPARFKNHVRSRTMFRLFDVIGPT